ncbi:MAG TPA: hypothetical protein VJZ27_04110, partial [Aggregatilineales bacterium]|nr:hypothetical protein [Aggregatilineales bacterium]
GGEGLYLWQYADFSWQWVLIGVMLVLFVRLIPLLWESFQRSLRSNRVGDIVNLVLVFVALVGILVFIFGMFTYRNYDNQLQLLAENEESLVVTTQSAAIDRDTAETGRRNGSIAAGVGILLALLGSGGLTFNALMAARDDDESQETGTSTYKPDAPVTMGWLLNTAAGMGVVALVLVFMRIVSARSFDSPRVLQLISILLIFSALESVGIIRTLIAGERRPGVGQMLTEGLSRGKSASMIIFTGAILGGILAIHAFSVLDIIKPDQVWVEQPVVAIATETPPPDGDTIATDTPEVETEINLDTRMGNALLAWIGVPVLVGILIVFLVAVFRTPTSMPLPWSDILAILLVAVITFGVLLFAERRSHIPKSEEDEATEEEPVAIDPNEESAAANAEDYNDNWILGTMFVMLAAAGAIAAWRFIYPEHWEFLNRQPAFDVLIVMGTLILPWLSAFPIFFAGYQLDAAPLPTETVEASILVTGAFIVLTTVIGMAWNWRMWLISVAVFMGLFVFFFTTVFTNGAGIFTGMVGSLGYWLEQQGVRRGSQPQYYYVYLQLPIYEYLPLILASLAGIAGITRVFDWRNRGMQTESETAFTANILD